MPRFFGSVTDSFPIIPIYFFVFIGVIFGSLAWLLDYKRGYIITLIFAISWGLNELMHFLYDSWAGGTLIFEVGGFIIIAMGLYVFVRFVKEHPRPEPVGEGM
jgi:hypothetical protein